MAVLEDIRQRSGLLLIVIGVAMLAFILGDFMQSKRSGFNNSPYIGEILKEEIFAEEFAFKLEQRINNLKSQNQNPNLTFDDEALAAIRDQIWAEYIQDIIMSNQFEDLGLDIIDKEWWELIQGENVHPQIASIPDFQDQTTNQFDPDIMVGFLKRIEENPRDPSRPFWLEYQKNMVNIFKNEKYNSLVSKGFFVCSEEAKNNYNENIMNVTFDYISIPFNTIHDSTIQVSDKEIKKYYKENIHDYQQKEEGNDIDFVQFLVEPSIEDDLETKTDLENLKEDFSTHEKPDFFANRNSERDNTSFFFATKDQFEDTLWTQLLSISDPVLGPYKTNDGAYRIAKIIATEYRPDSIQARHIVMVPSQEISIGVIDSTLKACKKLIEDGEDFGLLAQKYSQEQISAIRGGELSHWISENPNQLCQGQEKLMDSEFQEACFDLEKGELKIVTTNSGLHLLEVLARSKNQKKFKIAYIDFFVSPSDATFKNYWSQATEFAGRLLKDQSITFDSLVIEKDFLKRSATKVNLNQQNIIGLKNSRSLVQWMNNADPGDISKVLEIGNSFIVAHLTKSYKKGDIPLSDLKEEIIAKIKQTKKTSLLQEKVQNTTNLEDLANAFNLNVFREKKASLSSLVLDGVGYEPELIGSLFGLKLEIAPKLIKGRSSAFVVKVTARDEIAETGDFTLQKNQLIQNIQSYSSTAAYNSLQEKANIIDSRHNFY